MLLNPVSESTRLRILRIGVLEQIIDDFMLGRVTRCLFREHHADEVEVFEYDCREESILVSYEI